MLRGKAGFLFKILTVLPVLAVLGLAGCSGKDAPVPSATALDVRQQGEVSYQGGAKPARRVEEYGTSYAIPDGSGGVVLSKGDARRADEGLEDARELKLKVREMADQLLAGTSPGSMGMIVPTSFVQEADYARTSDFGRFFGRQMQYELGQRGFPISGYELQNNLQRGPAGDFILKNVQGERYGTASTYYIVGTYYAEGKTLFVTGHLINSYGQILRSGQLVMPASPLARKLVASGISRAGTSGGKQGGAPAKQSSQGAGQNTGGPGLGTLQIRDYGSQTRGASGGLGRDIH